MFLFATGMGFQFLNALFVQRVMGYDALGTGLAFLPTPIVIGLVSLFAAARLTARFGPRPVLLAGLAVLFAGLLLLARMPAHPSYWSDMFPPLVVMGLGVGVAIPSVIMLAMAGAAPADTGLVSGLGNTSQQAGGALGLAVLAAVAASAPPPSVRRPPVGRVPARRVQPRLPGRRRLRPDVHCPDRPPPTPPPRARRPLRRPPACLPLTCRAAAPCRWPTAFGCLPLAGPERHRPRAVRGLSRGLTRHLRSLASAVSAARPDS